MSSSPSQPSETDPAAALFAGFVRVSPGQTAVTLNAGRVTGALLEAMGPASTIIVADRSIIGVDTARHAFSTAIFSGDVELLAGHGAAALNARSPRHDFADVVAIRIPREKISLLLLLHDAFGVLRVGGRCYIAGATNEGIKTADRLMHGLFGNSEVLARRSSHRIVVSTKKGVAAAATSAFTTPFLDPDVFKQFEVSLRGATFTMCTRPGVFSWEHLDDATAALARVMQIEPGQSVLDIGCGAGALGVVAAALTGGGKICMVDADTEAVRCARRTADHAGARVDVIVSDVARAVIDERFDVVVTNPPFHTGKATDLSLAQRFIDDACTVLKPGGRIFLVANRTLPYEWSITRRFGNITTLHEDGRFKVLSAERR